MKYEDAPGMRQSNLKHIFDGFSEFKNKLDNPSKTTEPQKLGIAVHTLILEPENAGMIITVPDLDAGSRKGKVFAFLQEGKRFEYLQLTQNKTKRQEAGVFYEIDQGELDFAHAMLGTYSNYFTSPDNFLTLSQTAYDKAHFMVESFRKNSFCKEVMSSAQGFEKEIFFEYRGIKFKTKLDIFDPVSVSDIKTTALLNRPYKVKREIEDRLYNFQSAPYSLAYQEQFGELPEDYFLLFIRNEAPYTVFPKALSKATREQGMLLFDEACSLYNYALENNPEFIDDNPVEFV